MSNITENQLDNITHAALEKIRSFGISDIDELALNDALHEFLIQHCGHELVSNDSADAGTNTTPSTYAVCIEDSDYNEDWYLVETDLDLERMNESNLKAALGEKVIVGGEDRVFVSPKNQFAATSTSNVVKLEEADFS